MASQHLLPRVIIVPFLVLLCLSPACVARRVSVSVYYETLCPFCSGFVVNDLARMFQNGLSAVVDLRLVPFGNGRVSPDGSMTCQHGGDECRLNAVEACVIKLWPDASCFHETGLDPAPVVDCYNSGTGRQVFVPWWELDGELPQGGSPVYISDDEPSNRSSLQLELQNAAETFALQPPNQFVPWVVVDGRPLGDDYTNIEAYICSAYDGELPAACSGEHLAIAQHTKASRGDKRNPRELAIVLAFCIALWF